MTFGFTSVIEPQNFKDKNNYREFGGIGGVSLSLELNLILTTKHKTSFPRGNIYHNKSMAHLRTFYQG